MRLRKPLVAAAITLGVLAIPTTALADTCVNLSRAPGPCGTATTPPCTGPVVQGNWVWLPSVGAPDPIWLFAPPGGPNSVNFEFPGANGNYTNGKTESLLGVSNNCPPGNNPARQTDHGIQTGC
jgi:hypothetical protein